MNETFSHEHEKSVEQFHTYSKHIEGTFSTAVMIDDYNSTEDLLDVDDFIQRLDDIGAKPDFLAFEAQMGQYKEQMFAAIQNKRIYTEYERYINNKNKLPCSFMTAIWYLIRLGKFEANEGVIKPLTGKVFTPSKYLINILPERFRSVEGKTLQLIAATEFSEFTYNIEHVFFNSTQ